MQVIQRKEIPEVHDVKIGNVLHNLGIHKDFRRNPILEKFLPDFSRISVSWTHLDKDQTLEVHQHPTSSMIIVCEGTGRALGDVEQEISSGDIVVVPPNHRHGFIGTGKGFWALSIQFEGKGLYEDLENPRVKFVNQGNPEFVLLEQDQELYLKKYGEGMLLQLIRSEKIKDPEVLKRLLEALNFWSNWFQRILARRLAAGGGTFDKFQELAEDHFQEEIGHNKQVSDLRHTKEINFWDPILDACCTWFYEKMISGNEHEKVILVHLVMEGASVVFHHEATSILPKSTYFSLHNEVDDDHYEIGIRMLKEDSSINVQKLRETLKKGWMLFDLLSARLASYAETGDPNYHSWESKF